MTKSTGFRGFLRGFTDRVLDRPSTAFSRDQLSALEDLLAQKHVQEDAVDLQELVRVLKRKHVLDSLCISQPNGSLLASSEGNGVNESITASALFNYVQSEIPRSEIVLIRSNTWNMLFKYHGKIFIIKAPASLSTIELKAISKEVENFLLKNDAPVREQKKIQRSSIE